MATRQNRSFTTGSALATGPTQIGGPNPTLDYNTYVDLFTDVSQSQGSSTYVGESLFISGIDNQVTGSAYVDYPMKGVMVGGTGNKLGAISEFFDHGCQIFGSSNDICYTSNPGAQNYGYGSFYAGSGNQVDVNYGHVIMGSANVVSGSSSYAMIMGQSNNFNSMGGATFVGGKGNNTLTGGNVSAGVILGTGNTVHGTEPVAIGAGNTASGNQALAIGEDNDARRSILIGKDNIALQNNSVSVGSTNVANHEDRGLIAVGKTNTNTTNNTTLIALSDEGTTMATSYQAAGGGIATSGKSMLFGYRGEVQSPNSLVYSNVSSNFAVGAMQEVKSFLTCTTTDATPKAAESNCFPKSDSSMGFSYTVTARRTDVDGHSAYWTGSGLITNDAGTVAIIDSVSKTEVAKVGFTTVDIAFTEDTSNDSLKLTVTGEAGQAITWHAVVTQNIVVG